MKVWIFIYCISLAICVITAQMKIVIHKQHPFKITAVRAPKEQYERGMLYVTILKSYIS